MERSDFLNALREACRDLRDHFPKTERKWLNAIISGTKENDPAGSLSDDRIYELMCCFSLLGCLKSNVQNLRLISGTGKHGFRFPYSPGMKESFAFFRFEKDGDTYDVCCGTAVMPPNGKLEPFEHPDISLQSKGRAVSDRDKSSGRLLALWDAKYHSKRAAKSDVQQMNWWCSIFVLPKYRRGDLLSLLPPTFQLSAVITNADKIPFNHALLLKNRFSVVFGFNGGTSASPTPSRPEHESQP